jgi:hypothetical protein
VSMPLVCTDQLTSSAALEASVIARGSLLETARRGIGSVTAHNTPAITVRINMRMPRIVATFGSGRHEPNIAPEMKLYVGYPVFLLDAANAIF